MQQREVTLQEITFQMRHRQRPRTQIKYESTSCQDKQKMASQKGALAKLVRQLNEAHQDRDSLDAKLKQAEESLQRANNRIAQLSLPDSRKGSNVVPGVSRKVLESLTRENTELKDALKRVTENKNGPRLAMENRDLHEIIVTLRDDRDEKVKDIEKLVLSLTAIQDEDESTLTSQVASLTLKVRSLERNLRVNEVLVENLTARNEAVMKILQAPGGEKVVKVGDSRNKVENSVEEREVFGDLLAEAWDDDRQDEEIEKEIKETEAEMKRISGRGWDARQDEHGEMFRKKVEAKAGAMVNHDDDDGNDQALEAKIDKLVEELEREKQERERLQEELKKSAPPPPEDVPQQLNELQEALGAMKKERDELQTESELMKGQISSYEDEFKMERREKEKAMNDRRKLEAERDKCIEIHNRLQRDYANLKQKVMDEYGKPRKGYMPLSEPCCGPRPDAGQVRALPVPGHPMRVGELECPGCKKMFPHYLLEDHMRSCCQ